MNDIFLKKKKKKKKSSHFFLFFIHILHYMFIKLNPQCIATSNKSIASAVIDLEEVFVHNKISRSFELVGKQPHEGTINLDFTYMVCKKRRNDAI